MEIIIIVKKKYNKFAKSLKDSLNKGKNGNNIIINNKEDIKNNINHSEGSPKILPLSQNSKYKELEIKCIAELSNRKVEIDSILDSEED